MIDLPTPNIPDDLIGDLVQICLVTRDHRRTIANLCRLGIGPWRMHVHTPKTTQNTLHRGAPHSFSAIMGYTHSANIMWEVVEPTEGTGIFNEFLETKGEGVHHLGFTPRGRSFSEAVAEFERRGFQIAQSGRVWGGSVGFAFVGAEKEFGVFFELWDHPPNFAPPPPEYWLPAPPPEAT